MKKGQVTITVASAFAIGTAIVSALGSYYTSQMATGDKISEVKIQSAINTTAVTNIEKRLDRFEEKIDALLERQGINPLTVIKK